MNKHFTHDELLLLHLFMFYMGTMVVDKLLCAVSKLYIFDSSEIYYTVIVNILYIEILYRVHLFINHNCHNTYIQTMSSFIPKLYYFDLAGKGEAIRLAAAYSGFAIEDIRLTRNEFAAMKEVNNQNWICYM